jgi:hypothetical protein
MTRKVDTGFRKRSCSNNKRCVARACARDGARGFARVFPQNRENNREFFSAGPAQGFCPSIVRYRHLRKRSSFGWWQNREKLPLDRHSRLVNKRRRNRGPGCAAANIRIDPSARRAGVFALGRRAAAVATVRRNSVVSFIRPLISRRFPSWLRLWLCLAKESLALFGQRVFGFVWPKR